MSAKQDTPRPYRSSDHLWSIAEGDAGRIAVHPLRSTSIYFDAAKANHVPAYAPTGDHGSTVLDIGRGVVIRASGNVGLVNGEWRVTHLYTSRDMGGDLTVKQSERAHELITEMVAAWAATHEGDIAQADDIDRNNNARRLEEEIAKHLEALKILRRNVRRCDEGQSYETYPSVPTQGR